MRFPEDDDSSSTSDLSSLSSSESLYIDGLPKPTKPLPRARISKPAAPPDYPISRSTGPENRHFDFTEE
jgi:hypothetical protein